MYTTLSHENMRIIHTANFNRIFLEWHTIIQVEDEKVQFEGSNQNFDDKAKVSIGKDCLSRETTSQPLTIVNTVQCSNLEIWTLNKGKGNIKIQPTSPFGTRSMASTSLIRLVSMALPAYSASPNVRTHNASPSFPWNKQLDNLFCFPWNSALVCKMVPTSQECKTSYPSTKDWRVVTELVVL